MPSGIDAVCLGSSVVPADSAHVQWGACLPSRSSVKQSTVLDCLQRHVGTWASRYDSGGSWLA